MTTRDVLPPDLKMQVKTVGEHGRTRLIYTLDSPQSAVGFSHQEITGPLLHGNPQEYQAHLLLKIEQLGQRLDVDGSTLLREDIDRKLTSLGRELWRELFPAEIRYAYRDIREHVRSWMIVSDEPWIPWELVRPYDDSRPGDVIDDDFLVFQFELTRWLAGDKTPAPEIVVRSLAALRTAADLPQSKQELELLKNFAGTSPGVVDATPTFSSASDLLKFLESRDVHVIHFIGHGTREAARADESGIPLPDGSVLRPFDLQGPVATRIGLTRPLVFLNACWAGQQGWSLTRLGGWAPRWVSVCGCGAFVAPLWPARDQAALAFAWAFYDSLARGCTLGQAALKARQHVRQKRPGDPSALAYTVYGHPNARLRLGADVATAEEVAELPKTDGLRPLPREGRIRPWLRAHKALLAKSSVACGLALILHLAAGSILDQLFPMDQRPASDRTIPTPPAPKRDPVRKRPDSTGAATTAVATGGLRFEISGGQTGVNNALKTSLKNAASALVEQGISGWTFSLQLNRPRITFQTQEGFPMKTCWLSGQASVKGPAGRVDLGTIDTKSAQFDEAEACAAAAESIADPLLNRFVETLGSKGES